MTLLFALNTLWSVHFAGQWSIMRTPGAGSVCCHGEDNLKWAEEQLGKTCSQVCEAEQWTVKFL